MDNNLPISAVFNGPPDVELVRALERQLIELPQVDLNTQMLVHGQMCARTILIPAGTMLTGALTKCDNISVVCGDITVTTDEGPRHLAGFNVIPANAGAKRVGLAHSDTYWTTLHHTELKDLAAISAEMTDDDLQTTRLMAMDAPDLLEGE